MIRAIVLSVFVFLTLVSGYGQEVFYKVVLRDAEEKKQPIRNAELTVEQKNGLEKQLFVSNSKGEVIFRGEDRKASVVVKHVAYEPLDTVLVNTGSKGDTITHQLFLSLKSYESTDIIVTNPFKPVPVFGSDRLSVEDFELLSDGKMVLLTYERKLRKGAEVLLVDDEQKVLDARNAGDNAKQLVHDFRGNVHLVTSGSVYHLFPDGETIQLYKMEKAYYDKYVQPVIDTMDNRIYFSNYQEMYPAVDFFSFDKLDSVYTKLTSVTDEVMMEMYLAEYKYVDVRTKLWAREMEQELGVDKEIIVGATVFSNSILYKEIYAPLFLKEDTIYVFDYYRELMKVYDCDGKPIDSISISHHIQPRKTGWKNQLLQDRYTGQVYAVYEKAGTTTLRAIDLATGKTGEGIVLHYKYVDKLEVYNNSAYYIYRPFESAQKKFLYRERLPLEFKSAKTNSGDSIVRN